MVTTEEENSGSPNNFESVKNHVNETLNRVKQIDRQIETMPKDAKLTPAPRPSRWYNNQKHPGNQERNIAFLKDEQDRLKTNAFKEIEKATRDADGLTQRAVRDEAREKLFPNPIRQMNKEERTQERAEAKKTQKSQDYIERSQDYFDAIRLDKAAERNAKLEPDSRTADIPVQAKEASLSASERFARTLAANKFIEQGRDMVKPDRAPDMDKG